MFKIEIENNAISVIRKDTGMLSLSLDNHVLDTGDILTLTVAKELNTTDYLFQIELTEFVEGQATFVFETEHTDIDPGTYYYDIQANLANGVIDTVVGPAKFKVLGGVSN